MPREVFSQAAPSSALASEPPSGDGGSLSTDFHGLSRIWAGFYISRRDAEMKRECYEASVFDSVEESKA